MLANTAVKIDVEDDVIQEIGTVVEVKDGDFVLSCERGTYHAKRAVSCLVEPVKDDEVLFAGRWSGALYILAILERADESQVTLRARGDMTVQVNDGRFAVAAAKGVDLVSSRDISLTSEEVQLRAKRGHLFIKSLEFLGDRLLGEVDTVRLHSKKLERLVENVVDRVKRSYRYIAESDHLRAGNMDYVSEETMRLKGRNALVHADLLVKLDGDQIHLG